MPAFSLLAVAAVGLLSVSGLYLTQLHLGSLEHLLSSPYGRVLLAKLALVALMLALGGYHQFVAQPQLLAILTPGAGSQDRASQRFRRTLRIEAVLGLSALCLAVLLGSTAPPTLPSSAVARKFRQVQHVDEAQVSIEISPVRPGPNTIRLSVTDRHGRALTDVTAALLQLQVEGGETAPIGVALDPQGAGRFVKSDAVLGIEGKWKGLVTIQRQGAYDLHGRFELLLTEPSDHGAPTPTAASYPVAAGIVYGGILGATVLLLIVSKHRLSTTLQCMHISNRQQRSD
jgi:copper transport protein